MAIYSAPINLVRYDNGKVVTLTASAGEFVSYDYDFDRHTGTFLPSTIEITATFQGDITYGKWQYSSNGTDWSDITDYTDGVTATANKLTIQSSSSLFGESNTYVNIRCVADDPQYADTISIGRIVDPVVIYEKASTQIEQTNSKIALIATNEQLSQWTTTRTMATKMAEIDVKADGIMQTVQADYQTKDAMDDYVLNTNLSSTITQTVNNINLAVENKSLADALSDKASRSYVATEIDQAVDGISANVWQSEEGQKVLAATANLDADGLHVSTSGDSSTSTVTGAGLVVTKEVSGSTVTVAEFTNERVYTRDLSIAGYTSFGAHRVEGISGKEWDGTSVVGTAWAWVGKVS